MENAKVVRVEQKPVYSPEELSLYQKTPQIKHLFAAAQRFLGGSISFPNLSLLYSFYDYYRLPIDVVEYLMEYCASTGNTNLRYMEKIVQDWADKGVQTVEAAKNQLEYYREYYPIMKALGLQGRRPSDNEQQYMNRWLKDYRSSMDLIQEAAARTLSKTGKASFPYMDSILKNWKDQQLTTLQDVEQSDSVPAARRKTAAYGAFHTYSSSGSDYDSIGENARRQMFADAQEE
jgi:DnaD/phage-associated family protein